MKLILIIICMFASQAYAKEEVNLDDKTDSYKIMEQGKKIGDVTISARFVGEAILESTEIKISIQCAASYKLDEKFKKNQKMMVYDYGAKGKLSEWNSATNTLKIFYRTAKNVDEAPVIEKSVTLNVDLAKACKKK